jgi:hypothetical protein
MVHHHIVFLVPFFFLFGLRPRRWEYYLYPWLFLVLGIFDGQNNPPGWRQEWTVWALNARIPGLAMVVFGMLLAIHYSRGELQPKPELLDLPRDPLPIASLPDSTNPDS